MPTIPARKLSRAPYWLRFSLILLSLGGITSAFVLVVLPRRFVLQAGLVESGVTFPTHEPPFDPPQPRPVIRPQSPVTLETVELGPAESFWNDIVPLMDAGLYEATFPLFREYLSHYPEDTTAWQEYAVALIRSGRNDEAEQVYRMLLAGANDASIKRELARLMRDRGEFGESIAIYRDLAQAEPDDLDLLHELAQTLVWAEAYQLAIGEYRRLLDRAPDNHGYRVELAQALYWDDLPVQGYALLSDFPPDVPESTEAASLRAFLDSVIHASMPPGLTTLEQARRAVANENSARAHALYRRALQTDHDNPDVWLEWVDFLQFHEEDLPAARAALRQLAQLRSLTWEERYRRAQLDVWTGNDDEARLALQQLVVEDPTNDQVWTLLGDLYFWQGSHIAAADAYQRALKLSPTNTEAAAGLEAVKQQTVALVAAREDPNAGPRFLYFEDSDDFSRIDLTVEATILRSTTGAVVRGGFRKLEGTGLSGLRDSDAGPFLELEVVQWWRFGTVRTSLKAGVEQLDAAGRVPVIEARLEVPNAGGTALTALYSHGSAFSQTLTYESVEASLLSDYGELSAFRQLGDKWSVSGNGTVGSLHATGTSNLRISAAASTRYQLSSVWSATLVSQLLTFADAAPTSPTRRLYWDPRMFWANGIQVELRTPLATRWEIYARVTPGIALDDERDTPGAEWVPQLGTVAGFGFQKQRVLIAGDLAYSRGREGGYSSFGATLMLAIRY